VVYYPWLGDALYIGIDASKKWPNDPNASGGPGDLEHVVGDGSVPILVASDNLTKDKGPDPNNPLIDNMDLVTVGLDVPVFEDYYNAATDVDPKPSHLHAPTVKILKSDTARYNPQGIELGAEIKIQVTNLYKIIWP
jgi:hypothetical protein